MRNNKTHILILAVGLLLVSCVKESIYDTSHPTQGEVVVTADWSGISKDAVVPANYILSVNGVKQMVYGATNTFENLLDPNNYNLLVYNTPENVVIDGTTATINEKADGTLELFPGYLFSATKDLNVVQDNVLCVNMKMVQSIQTLVIVLRLNPGDDARVVSNNALLSGVANTIDLTTGKPNVLGLGKSAKPIFELKMVDDKGASSYPILTSDALHLAGFVSGVKQVLTLSVSLNNGTTQNIDTDLTLLLKDFGVNNNPMALYADLTLPSEGNVTGSISNWELIDNGNININ
ncbi:MAG: hypothetical protein RSB85_06225 [Rikenellaceae bacterium]